MIPQKSYKVIMSCGAELAIKATGCARALAIATEAGWMPWDIVAIEERYIA
jgi:hypothetical protein